MLKPQSEVVDIFQSFFYSCGVSSFLPVSNLNQTLVGILVNK